MLAHRATTLCADPRQDKSKRFLGDIFACLHESLAAPRNRAQGYNGIIQSAELGARIKTVRVYLRISSCRRTFASNA